MNNVSIWNWVSIVLIIAGEISLILVYLNNLEFIAPALIVFPVSLLFPVGTLLFAKKKVKDNYNNNEG